MSRKLTRHFPNDIGYEFCTPDPHFEPAVVLGVCGYALRCWCAGVCWACVPRRHLPGIWNIGELVVSFAAGTEPFGSCRDRGIRTGGIRRGLRFIPSSIPPSPSTKGRRPANAICSCFMQRLARTSRVRVLLSNYSVGSV